jgi:hypothetical protein
MAAARRTLRFASCLIALRASCILVLFKLNCAFVGVDIFR